MNQGPVSLGPRALYDLLADGEEFALLDVRAVGKYSEAHLWQATNLPLCLLELRIRRLVPRFETRVVLCDDDNGLAQHAAEALEGLGYNSLYVLQGGVDAWRASGYPITNGNYVIAHCFGYAIEAAYKTPVLTADELRRRIANNERLVVMDARDESDYAAGSIPGSLSIPAAEVIHRVMPLLEDQDTPIVVHCAGITRAALGAQGLINCGVQNPVYALVDGTRGWVMAGGKLETGQESRLDTLAEDRGDFVRKAVDVITGKFGLRRLPLSTQQRWQADNPHRTSYFIDVRSRAEYEAGHLRGALFIPGGELAGMTVDHLATWHARLCLLAEPCCGRAELTASWMQQLGWSDVVVIDEWRQTGALETGPESDPCADLSALPVDAVSPAELRIQLAGESGHGASLLLDFSPSRDYRSGHVPGAVWASRSQLLFKSLMHSNMATLICTSTHGRVGRLAAHELKRQLPCRVMALDGGNQAWADAGLTLTMGDATFLGEVDDVDETVSGPDNDDLPAQLAWHQKCIRWRHTLYPAFTQSAAWSFALPD